MTTPPATIAVQCPKCGERYETVYRPSINLTLGEKFSEEYIKKVTTGVCPRCKTEVRLGCLVVSEDGVFQARE